MKVLVVEHPLVAAKVTALRDVATGSPAFRRLVDELVTLLAVEATRDLRVEPCTVNTPLALAPGVRVAEPQPLVVPILRAGLGMLDGLTRLLPTAEVGFLGMIRNERTLQPASYATRLPDDLAGRQVLILDPMLATGGTMAAAVHELRKRGAGPITAICLLGAPEGLRALEGTPGLRVVLAALDPGLNDTGYIVPGLGDAGDRLYGVV
jgi:uracil phosphoribosyltransferase